MTINRYSRLEFIQMIFIKRLLVIAALFIIGLQLNAETAKIEILFTNDTFDEIILDRHYAITFNDGNLTIKNEDISLNWPISDVASISFKDIQTSHIANVTVQSRYIISKDAVSYDFGNESGNISLYSMNGDLAAQAECSSGTCTLKFDDIIDGFYIVKAKDETIKILIKR